ncbi:MAG: alpha/beta hydrolase [Burkholderiales bacterium]
MLSLPAFTTLGSGPTVLMLHDIGANHLAFAPQVESFALSGYRAVAWDMPGYGRSAPVEPYNFKALAQSCVGLIEALRVTSVSVIGHGMGGMVAQELAARRPDLVNRLILCGAPSRCLPAGVSSMREAEAWRADFLALHNAPLDAGKSMEEFAATLIPRLIGPASLPEGVQLAANCMAQVNPLVWRRALQASADFDRANALQSIRVPTLIVAGEFDTEAPPAVLQAMADAIDGCSYAEMRGIGHLMQLEAPEQFDGLVLDFLASSRAVSRSTLH